MVHFVPRFHRVNAERRQDPPATRLRTKVLAASALLVSQGFVSIRYARAGTKTSIAPSQSMDNPERLVRGS